MVEISELPPEIACAMIAAQLAFHLDEHEDQAFVDLFADDGHMIVQGEAHDRAGIAAVLAKRSRERITRHVFGAPWVRRSSATEATARLYLLHFAAPFEPSDTLPLPMQAPAALGEYVLSFRLTEHGWRIIQMELKGHLKG